MLNKPQTTHKYPLGLLYSSLICISCIVIILVDQRNRLETSESIEGKASKASLGSINTRDMAVIWGGGAAVKTSTGSEQIAKFIANQSEQQRHTMQIENTSPDFHPEILISKYFKTFNGDVSSMQK